MEDNSTRDRIRALVRDVLDKALLQDGESGHSQSQTSSRFIDTAPKNPVTPSGTTTTRDESSKTVITEDDVRELAPGSILRIAEGARLTPLAADIVSEKRIEIVRRVPRRGSRASKLIAVGADHGGFKMKEELKALLKELVVEVRVESRDSIVPTFRLPTAPVRVTEVVVGRGGLEPPTSALSARRSAS